MFYSQIILAKKGPLGQLWMAAHFQDKKLSRQQIFATDITASVDSIVKPAVPLALRVSGHLLLGVVRIYSRKVHFLWQDCHNANMQIQLAFVQQQKPSSSDKPGIDMEPDGKHRRKRRSRASHRYEDDEEEGMATAVPATTAMEGFGIPFDLNDDTVNNAEDWVPAELDKDEENKQDEESVGPSGFSVDGGSPREQRRKLARAAADQTLHSMDDTATAEGRSLAGTQEEQWTAFNPDDEEEEEGGAQAGGGKGDNMEQDDDGEPPMMPPDDDDEEPPMMPPDDDEQQEEEKGQQQGGDQSSLQAEVPRGGGSVASADTGEAGRPSVLDQGGAAASGRARMSEAEFSVPNDVSGIPILDDDEGPGAAGRASSLDLDQASAASAKPHDESSAAAVSLGGGSSPEESTKKKRKSNAKARRRKRRKIRNNEGEMELTSDQIRRMLKDTSDIVVVPPPIGSEEEDEQPPKDLRGLLSTQVDEGLMRFLSYDQLFRRPGLADDGNAAPELIELWARVARLRDEAQAHAERQADQADAAEAQQRQDGEEEGSVEDAEVPRQQEKQDDESTEAPPPMPEDDEEPPMMPPDDEEDEGIPPPVDDEEPPMMPPDDDEVMEEDEEQGAASKRTSSLSLGLANTLGGDWDEEEEEEDRQVANSDELVSSNSKWHKHTVKVYSLLKSRLAPPGASEEEAKDKEPHLGYNALAEGCSRHTAVGLFLEVLQLKTWDYIECQQDEAYGDITVSPGPKFDEPVPSA